MYVLWYMENKMIPFLRQYNHFYVLFIIPFIFLRRNPHIHVY